MIGTHKTTVYTDNGTTKVKYHQTDVVKFNNERIVLDSGGWETSTTKKRMNQTSDQFDLGYYVFQKSFVWYVDFKGDTFDFVDNMILYR